MKIAIITSGYMPVPAVMGGAVETLDDYLIEKNEEHKLVKFTVFGTYHKQAEKAGKTQTETEYILVKTPLPVKQLDRAIYWAAKYVLHKKKLMSYRYIVQRLWYLNQVSKFLQRNNYDRIILENHSTLFLTLKKRGNAKKYAGRYYYHLHNVVTNDYGCREIMRNTRKVLAVSDFISRSLSNYLGSLYSEQMVVLRNCVDLNRFGNAELTETANQLRSHYSILPDELVILFSGRMTEEKGIRYLLSAFAQADLAKTKLVIAGGYFYASDVVSNFEYELYKIAEPIQEKVVFTGFIPHEKMPAVYAMADIACMPSLCNEAAALTVIESMASGLPLITTDSGGIPEYANEDCAIILPRDEYLVDNLTEAMKKLTSNNIVRMEMAEAAKATAADLNLENYYRDFIRNVTE